MSTFYQSLPYNVARSFKKRKQRFKRNKPCCICGKMYPPDEMMVAHKKPASELTDWEALYDVKNWEVRCIFCERELNRRSDIINKRRQDVSIDQTDGGSGEGAGEELHP
jgi:hypothetical protein